MGSLPLLRVERVPTILSGSICKRVDGRIVEESRIVERM